MLQQDTISMPEFTHSDTRIAALLDSVHEIVDLASVAALAEWDQNTDMPEGAGGMRGDQMATLQGILHERWTSERLGRLVAQLDEVSSQANLTDADKGLIREVRRGYYRATKLPRTLVEELARVQAGSFEAWRRARTNNDFASFAPWLSRTISLQRELADRLGFVETRYDALLDQFEPGMTSRELDALFTPVREVSTTLLKRIQDSNYTVDDTCLAGEFADEQQMELSKVILHHMGYEFTHGGISRSPHPFTTSFGSPFDVRLTVNPDPHFIQASVMAAIHEGGHALYEQGCAPTLARTLLASGASMGAHESQSRIWENNIGRSLPFWQGQYAAIRAAFPDHFANVPVETFVLALNKVQPSLIRIEADEVTYNLHIIIRYELERAMVNEDISVESLPGLWNAKYREYLGIEPETDSNGILQDIHWSSGFGYFPTYTLGNLYGAQIFHTLHNTFADFDERLAKGETSFVLRWLEEHMYAYGVTYLPQDLVKRVTGEQPNPAHFVRYLTQKFESIYHL
jgi:carboxypeptidase Taq